MAQRLTIQIKNKIASWVSGEPIVCGNGDYEVEFLFDAEWDAHDIKTAIFNVNGDAISKAFTGTICKVPIIWNTLMVSVGVFAGEIDDGTLSTSTPALVECLRCATDGGNLVGPPKNDVYMDIVQMVEELNTEIEELKKGGASEEQIADAVRDYLEKNPINESDPTVPAWAKASEKPKYTAKEVGALPKDTPIPSIDGLATEKYVDEKVAGIKIPESGTTDYTNLKNKPKINGVELDGDKTLEALGIPTGGGGVVGGSGKWELIGEVVSDGTGGASGIYIPIDFTQYKEVFIEAWMTASVINRVLMSTNTAWYSGQILNTNSTINNDCGNISSPRNENVLAQTVIHNICGELKPFSSWSSGYAGGCKPVLQVSHARDTFFATSYSYIRMDTSNNGAVAEGSWLKVWGCK